MSGDGVTAGSAGLKAGSASKGLSRAWRLTKAQLSAYTGGKVELSSDGAFLACLCGDDVAFLSVAGGALTKMLRGGEDDDLSAGGRGGHGVGWTKEEDEEEGFGDLGSGQREGIVAFCLHPDARHVATASAPGGIASAAAMLLRLWDIRAAGAGGGAGGEGADSACVKVIKMVGGAVRDIAYDPSGTLVATASADRVVRVWDVAGGFCTHSLRGHRGVATLVSFHPDASRLQLVSAAEDHTVRVWDLAAAAGGGQGIGGKAAAAAKKGKKGKGGKAAREHCAVLAEHAGTVTAVAWGGGGGASSSSASLLLSAGRDQTVHAWHVPRCDDEAAGGVSGARHLKTVPTYESLSGVVVLPAPATTKAKAATTTKKKASKGAAGAAAGAAPLLQFATAGERGRVKLWQLMPPAADGAATVGHCVLTATQPRRADRAGIQRLLLLPAQAAAAAGVRGGGAGLLAATDEHNFAILTTSSAAAAAAAAKGATAAGRKGNAASAASAAGTAQLPPLSLSRLVVGHNDEIIDAAWLDSGEGGAAGDEAVDDAGAATALRRPSAGDGDGEGEGEGGAAKTTLETPVAAGALVLATNSPDVRLLQLRTGACELLSGHSDTVVGVALCPRRRFLATASKDSTVRVWDLQGVGASAAAAEGGGEGGGEGGEGGAALGRPPARGRCVAVLEGHAEAVGAAAWSTHAAGYAAGSAFLVTASKDRTLKRWAMGELRSLGGGGGGGGKAAAAAAAAAAEAAEAEAAAAASSGDAAASDAARRDADAAHEAALLRPAAAYSELGHDKEVNCLAVSPNNAIVASASQDRTIKLWAATDLRPLGTCRGHKRGVWSVRFSPVDQVLASASGDRTVRLWCAKSFACLQTFEGHTASVLQVRFLTAGMQLLSAGADGLVKLWTIKGTKCEATVDAHADKAWALDARPDGAMFVSGGADGALRCWADVTAAVDAAEVAGVARRVESEQRLLNLMRAGDWAAAVPLALELEQVRGAARRGAAWRWSACVAGWL